MLTPEITIGFCKASMLSPDGRCKAFDAARQRLSSAAKAAALVVLKPLDDALADGDRDLRRRSAARASTRTGASAG